MPKHARHGSYPFDIWQVFRQQCHMRCLLNYSRLKRQHNITEPVGDCFNVLICVALWIYIRKHIKSLTRYQDLGLAQVDPKSLSFHVDVINDQLILQFLQWLIYDGQVICIKCFQGHPARNSWEIASRNFIKQQGAQEVFWWTPIFTLNSSTRLQLKHLLLLSTSYKLCMRCINHSSTPRLRRAHHITRLDTRANTFPRLTNAMYNVLFTAQYLGGGGGEVDAVWWWWCWVGWVHVWCWVGGCGLRYKLLLVSPGPHWILHSGGTHSCRSMLLA